MKNKVVVVTGGSRGIGFDIVKLLLSQNYRVVSISRNSNRENFNKLKKLKKNFFSYECNVSDSNQVKEIFEKKIKKIGNLYGLINNAGINPSRNVLHKTSIGDWQSTINTNINGPFYCSKFFIENLIKKKSGGIIINIASIAGIVALEKRASYSTSKGALISLTKSIAIDYAKNNIRSFCICPAYIKTELTGPFLDKLSKKDYNKLLGLHKLGRLGKESDVSEVVSFLLSEKAEWLTGNIIPVDGGYVV